MISKESLIGLAETGFLPDFLIRLGIRNLCKKRLLQTKSHDCEESLSKKNEYLEKCNSSDIAPLPEKANDQHYEVPSDFYKLALGKRLKYSGCFWPEDCRDLNDAEERSLKIYGDRAKLEDGQKILELGCGWGSLTLWMAEKFPHSEITAVSNSKSQKEYIKGEAVRRGLSNVEVITTDINDFQPEQTFDRIVTVEMLEHVRNHTEIFKRISKWLKDSGLLFIHIFCHKSVSYAFDGDTEDDWMSKYFFSGGTMPSDDLFLRVCGRLKLVTQHRWSGVHYAKTAEAWLENIDANKKDVINLFSEKCGPDEAKKMYHRWRIFFLACAETFAYSSGQEWWVAHYLFELDNA